MPFVICIDYKGNQSRIVISSMSTQQWMTLPGLILSKCYFQFTSACSISLVKTMVYCPRGRDCWGDERSDTETKGIWVPPGTHHEWGGGRHLHRGLYFGFLPAQLRPGTNPEGGHVGYEHVPLVVCSTWLGLACNVQLLHIHIFGNLEEDTGSIYTREIGIVDNKGNPIFPKHITLRTEIILRGVCFQWDVS